MKYRLFLMVLSMFTVAHVCAQSTLPSVPSALFSKSVVLNDGDSIGVTPQYPSDELCAREKEIINKYTDQILSSGILKSFEIQKHEEDLRNLMTWNFYGKYIDRTITSGFYLYNDYFRNLLKVKAVRVFGRQLLSDLAVEFCSYFPKDFKAKLISELEDVVITLNKCKKHRYACVDESLSVDGKIDNELAYTFEGFIARRICLDNIPVSEMEDFVESLLKRLRDTNTGYNDDVLYRVEINGELVYYLGTGGPFFVSEKNRKKTIPFDNQNYLNYISYGQKVFYNAGDDGRYYRICNQYFYNGEWKPLYRGYDDVREIILDPEGVEIYRNNTKPTE